MAPLPAMLEAIRGSGRSLGSSRPTRMLFSRKSDDFEASVKPELPVLYRVAKRMCRSPEDVEDVVSQTLYRACGAWHRFDGKYLRSWLITILRNELRNQTREARARPDQEPLEDDMVIVESCWDEVNWRMASDRILEELDQLPAEFRLAVQLCDVEQMSYEEAAAAMEVPIGTVRSRLFRGRLQLRNRLAGFVAEGIG